MEKGPLAGGTRAALTLGVDTEAGFECTAKMGVPSWRRARRPEGVAGGPGPWQQHPHFVRTLLQTSSMTLGRSLRLGCNLATWVTLLADAHRVELLERNVLWRNSAYRTVSAQDVVTECHRLSGFNNRDGFSPQFRRPEV